MKHVSSDGAKPRTPASGRGVVTNRKNGVWVPCEMGAKQRGEYTKQGGGARCEKRAYIDTYVHGTDECRFDGVISLVHEQVRT